MIKRLFLEQEVQYVENNPMPNQISEDDISNLLVYVNDTYFANGKEGRK